MATTRRRRQSWFPPQHGAWAFIGLPVALGFVLSAWTPLLLLTALASVAAFPLSHFATAILRYPHKGRYVRPLVLWSVLSVPAAAVLAAFRPWLLLVLPLYLLAFGANVWFARHRRDRSLNNDLVFIVECAALIPLMWGIGASGQSFAWPDWSTAGPELWVVTAASVLAMIGSTLHVKSLIRERANPAYRRASQVFAFICVPVSLAIGTVIGPIGLLLGIPFAYLLARSLLLRDMPLKPGILGVIELGGFLLILGAVAVIAAVAG